VSVLHRQRLRMATWRERTLRPIRWLERTVVNSLASNETSFYIIVFQLQNQIFDLFEGRFPEKAASVEADSIQAASTPPPTYLAAMAREAQGETMETRVSNLYDMLVQRHSEGAFTEQQVRLAVAAELNISGEVEVNHSSRAETPEHLGCFLNPCTECLPPPGQ